MRLVNDRFYEALLLRLLRVDGVEVVNLFHSDDGRAHQPQTGKRTQRPHAATGVLVTRSHAVKAWRTQRELRRSVVVSLRPSRCSISTLAEG